MRVRKNSEREGAEMTLIITGFITLGTLFVSSIAGYMAIYQKRKGEIEHE